MNVQGLAATDVIGANDIGNHAADFQNSLATAHAASSGSTGLTADQIISAAMPVVTMLILDDVTDTMNDLDQSDDGT
jgi:hypothetical protein